MGAPDDHHEREAARIAEHVTSEDMEHRRQRPTEVEPHVQRQAAAARAAGSPGPPAAETPARNLTQEDLTALASIQRVAVDGAASSAEAGVEPELGSRLFSPGPGWPVPPRILAAVQPWLPYDFSGVRVHETPQARRDAAALRARAFTFGRNVWLGAGEAATDLRLMSHELTHVAQQGAVAWRPLPGATVAIATPAVARVQRDVISDYVLAPVRDAAARLPGFPLLTVLLGRNPITDQPVERTPLNLARGVLDLVPNGDAILRDLQASGALQRAFEVIQEAWVHLGFTWDYIRGIVDRIWANVHASDAIHPVAAAERLIGIVAEPARRIVDFARTTGTAILEVIFDAVMSALGPRAQRISGLLRRARQVFTTIINDPIGFVGHLMDALGQGFRQFGQNILQHLGQGLIAWLTGALSSAGIQLPAQWDFRGVLSIVLQVLGLSYASIRSKLVRALGERPVAIVERALPFLVTLVREGPAAAWQQLLEYIGSLRDTVIDGIRDWVRNTVVSQAIQFVLSLLTPAGVVIRAIQAIYRAINFVLDQADRLMALVETVVDSLAKIAAGQIGEAANAVENTLGRAVPVVIDLLARLLGLGDLPQRVKAIITGIHARVDQALDRLVAWIVERARALIDRAREAVQGVVAWWQARRTFEVGSERHAVFLASDDPDAPLMVGSFPQELEAYLSANRPAPSDTGTVAAFESVQAALRDVRPQLALARQAKRTGQPEPPGFAPAMDVLRDRLRALMLAHGGGLPARFTVATYGTVQDGLATSMTANPLTAQGETGTAPSAESDVWKLVRDRYKGGRTFYIRGHLLNQQLHGPGGEPGNLAPISQDDNQAHEREIEHVVKQRVLEQGKTVRYTVTLDYSPHSRNLDTLKTQLLASEIATDDRARVRSILEAEQKLPSGLSGEATELAETADHQLAEHGPPFVQKRIPLRIAEDLTGFDGARRRQEVVLKHADAAQIATIPDLPAEDVPRVVVAVRRLGDVALTRYDQLEGEHGLSEEVVRILRADRWTRLQ